MTLNDPFSLHQMAYCVQDQDLIKAVSGTRYEMRLAPSLEQDRGRIASVLVSATSENGEDLVVRFRGVSKMLESPPDREITIGLPDEDDDAVHEKLYDLAVIVLIQTVSMLDLPPGHPLEWWLRQAWGRYEVQRVPVGDLFEIFFDDNL